MTNISIFRFFLKRSVLIIEMIMDVLLIRLFLFKGSFRKFCCSLNLDVPTKGFFGQLLRIRGQSRKNGNQRTAMMPKIQESLKNGNQRASMMPKIRESLKNGNQRASLVPKI
ncbi:hypothetical protein B1NLA3E_05935 [Bacillus sp. 1NLA3E]|nr:hypothetical protein B1NLA3E_05935 [Bacillus sp. 1NLA3E]